MLLRFETEEAMETRLNTEEKARLELEQAFVTEAVPHMDALYSTALRLTKNKGDAEDLVQEAMLKAYRYFGKYERGTNCKAWMFKIMTNTFINNYRRAKKRKEVSVNEEIRPLAERAVASESNPLAEHFGDQDTMFFKLFGDEVKQALEDVPVDFRIVVLLADLQEFAYKEIADIIDVPIGTVMSRLYRGRRILQTKLAVYAKEQGYLSTNKNEAKSNDEDSNTTSLDEYRQRRMNA